jgi:hypothetical protein
MTGRDTEAVIIDTAWAICQRAYRLEATDDQAGTIAGTIATYDLIYSGTIHPAVCWPDLEPVTYPQAYDIGLRRATTDILKALGRVLQLAPWLIGT